MQPSDQLIIDTLTIMAGVESKQPCAISVEDNILFVAANRMRQLMHEKGNAVLAERIADLTRENSALKHQTIEQGKVIEHIALAVGEEDDPYVCHESVDALLAQVERLRNICEQLLPHADFALQGQMFNKLIPAAKKALHETPAQCLAARDADVAAQSVEALLNAGLAHGTSRGLVIGIDTLQQYANQLRQQAKE